MQGRGHFHAVNFYDSEASLCRTVAVFLKEGLMFGQPAVLVATPEHTAGILAELRTREVEVKGLQTSGDLVVADAARTIATFMVDGMPQREQFFENIRPILDGARRGQPDRVIRVYGEMVDLLWREGRDLAALQLETLWNQLGRTAGFSLMCGYAMGNFFENGSVQDVCRQHTHLVAPDGTLRISNADSLLVGTLRP